MPSVDCRLVEKRTDPTDQKCLNTRAIEEAFGPEFDQLWNEPAGARLAGRLGETYYRGPRDHRYADEIDTDRGDDAIGDVNCPRQTTICYRESRWRPTSRGVNLFVRWFDH